MLLYTERVNALYRFDSARFDLICLTFGEKGGGGIFGTKAQKVCSAAPEQEKRSNTCYNRAGSSSSVSPKPVLRPRSNNRPECRRPLAVFSLPSTLPSRKHRRLLRPYEERSAPSVRKRGRGKSGGEALGYRCVSVAVK